MTDPNASGGQAAPSLDGRRVLLALVLAMALGIAVAASGNASALAFANALRPIGTLWVNAIRMTVILLVVSLLITGIASVSDLKTVGRLGGRTLLIFGSLLIISALVSLAVSTALFAFYPSGASTQGVLPAGAAEAAREIAAGGPPPGVMEWFTTLIPSNPIGAAASGNMISLIVFAFLFALAVAHGPAEARATLVRFFTSMGDVMLLLVRWVIAAAPIAIFALVLPMAATSGAALVGAVGFYIMSIAVACAVVILVYYAIVRAWGGLHVGEFARAVMPAQLIGMSSTSSVATLPAMITSAERLRLPDSVSGFVLPLAVSTFKPAAPPMWIVGTYFISHFYGVPIAAREIGIVAAASVFLSFAAPGVPRGAWLLLTPLFVAIGLPAEGIGVLIAVDAIPDVCATVVNVTGDLVATALVGKGQWRGIGAA
ncbi:MAG: dicarboxylate/amino acid:cation symporter [Gemmatimonadaceae bacterium]